MIQPAPEPRCAFADDCATLESRVETLEGEVNRLRDHEKEQTARWERFLIDFGELKAKVENLNGRIAGYLVAGSLLTGALSLLAQLLLRKP